MKKDSKDKIKLKVRLENMNVEEQSRAGNVMHLLEMRALMKTLHKKKLVTNKELEVATRKEVKDLFKFIESNKPEIEKMIKEQIAKQPKKSRQDYFG